MFPGGHRVLVCRGGARAADGDGATAALPDDDALARFEASARKRQRSPSPGGGGGGGDDDGAAARHVRPRTHVEAALSSSGF